MKKIIFGLVASIALSAGAVSTSSAEDIVIAGSTTCQKRFLEPGNAALQSSTGINVKVLGIGTGKGMLALLEGQSPAAAVSSSMESALNSAKKAIKEAGKSIEIPSDLQFHQLFLDEIVPIVHKDNPVTSLSFEQLSDIHTGKIKNWSEVGGPDLQIRVVTSHSGSATREVFQDQVMKKQGYVKGAKEVRSTRQEIDEVSKFKGAIGAVSKGFHSANPQNTVVVSTDPISRPLALVTRGAPTPAVQKVIDFYRSDEGQSQLK